MFIVILDSTYRDLINHVAKEDITFLAYINTLMKGLIEHIDVYMKGRTQEEIESKYRTKKGLINKLKRYFELFYNNVVKKIQEKLWLLIKAVLIIKDKEYDLNKNQDQKDLLN